MKIPHCDCFAPSSTAEMFFNKRADLVKCLPSLKTVRTGTEVKYVEDLEILAPAGDYIKSIVIINKILYQFSLPGNRFGHVGNDLNAYHYIICLTYPMLHQILL